MELGANIDAVLKKYLLGDASAEEQESVDNWLMSDKQGYDLLEAAEDDLIDDVLAQRLEGRDLRLFNEKFLSTPERQRKFQLSLSFQRAVAAAQSQKESKRSIHAVGSFPLSTRLCVCGFCVDRGVAGRRRLFSPQAHGTPTRTSLGD